MRWGGSGCLNGSWHRLDYAPPDLVSREEAHGYPTDFAAMPEEWIEKLSRRGEQLTRDVIAEHMPELISGSSEASAQLAEGSP